MRTTTTTVLTPIALLVVGTLAQAMVQDAVSEETLAFFKNNCSSCHTIGGGRLTGPDLKGVTETVERDWLVTFVQDPKAMMDRGDAHALELMSEANGVLMPTLPGIDAGQAEKLIHLIEVESALEKSHFAGIQLDDRPLTEADVARGRELFLGIQRFQGGAPPCVSCHTLMGLSGLGGGHLGPDLTAAYGRLKGRKALGAWLTSPPSAVMQPVFQDQPLESDEILSLVALLNDEARSGSDRAEDKSLPFALAGIGIAAVLMVVFDVLWRGRFRSVRRTLVENS